MSPEEFWWLAETNTPQRMYGSLTEAEVEELYQELEDVDGD